MKRMIFHLPTYLSDNPTSGSEIRPIKMLQAFKNIGYEVDIVIGYVKERREQIKQIKQNIKNGVEYAFLYSESSTMPTALTEKHHFPIAPFLDFNFFRFCKRHNIRIGLFYRDVYWVFDEYKKSLSFFKRKISEFFYKYDLKNYKKEIDILYLPSIEMFEYIPFEFNREVKSLYPAIQKRDIPRNSSKNIKFIYVGGLSILYDLTLFAKVISEFKEFRFFLCTRKNEWDIHKNSYKKYRIDSYYLKGEELSKIYYQSKIAIYFIKPNTIWSFAMGVKLFEYISYKKPIIAIKGTTVGTFVEENNIGWSIEYNENRLRELLINIRDNPKIIDAKLKNIDKILLNNSWESRAEKVEKDLS
jgi:hypothetical protein